MPKNRLSQEEFIEIAKIVEIHIQKSSDYQACIGTGYFSERFNEAYKKYKQQNNHGKE